MLNRRSFIIASGLTALASTRVLGANDTVRVGVIGAGGRMRDLLDAADKVGPYQIVAVSDVYAPHRDAVKERSNGVATTHLDYREVLAAGHRCGFHRVPGPLARSHGSRCPGGRQRRLPGKACHPHHRGRRHSHPRGSFQQTDSAVRHAAAQLDSLSRCGRSDSGRQSRTHPAGADLLVAELSTDWAPKPIDAQALDWKLWLGSAPDQPFSEEKYNHWRWFWNFGGGAMTDLFTTGSMWCTGP